MKPTEIKALQDVLEYLHEDIRDYKLAQQESNPMPNHIGGKLLVLEDFLARQLQAEAAANPQVRLSNQQLGTAEIKKLKQAIQQMAQGKKSQLER